VWAPPDQHRDRLPGGRTGERHAEALALGAEEKDLFWIEDSIQRFFAYNYFGQDPTRLVGWFDKHIH
jgi:hypothetical protein